MKFRSLSSRQLCRRESMPRQPVEEGLGGLQESPLPVKDVGYIDKSPSVSLDGWRCLLAIRTPRPIV